MPLPKTYSAWHDLIKRYSLDLIILLAAIAVVVMLVIYEGKHIRDFYHTSSFFSPTSASTTGSASTSALPRAATSTTLTKAMELKIENVAFSMIEHEGHPRFIVKGELVNRSSMTLASPDLRVIVRVTCMDNPNEADKLCTLTKWVHPMFGTLIPAGSRQFFQTFAPHPGSIKAQEVEITGVPITTKEGN